MICGIVASERRWAVRAGTRALGSSIRLAGSLDRPSYRDIAVHDEG